MGIYLNSTSPYKKYSAVVSDEYFVDKTLLINELIPALGSERRFICITRPRRFGKTVMANMAAAFFGRAQDSSAMFGRLNIASCSSYSRHLNQHDVIFIDFSRIPRNCRSYEQYIERIQAGLCRDLSEAFPQCGIDEAAAVWDVLDEIWQAAGREFLFILDEWDAVFHIPYFTENDQKEYLLFLRNLLKDQGYVQLAYMTGVLPIAKYSSGSELNMFAEYHMATKEKYSRYFGFLDEEVDQLYLKYQDQTCSARISRDDLKWWYDGYRTAAGDSLYNPRSVVQALSDGQLGNYWTGSGPYDEIFYYIKGHMDEVRDDLAVMVSGGQVEARMQEYAATAKELRTKDQIYSAMVIYGLLTYENGRVMIPNKELMDQYNELFMSNADLGYVHDTTRISAKMLKATLAGDTNTMEEILTYAYDTESPLLAYNNEAELSALVNLVYLSARDQYRIEREDRAGRGYVDFIFYPQLKSEDGIILELKVDSSPAQAVRQIKEKNYALRFKGRLGEQSGYTGRILGVGISYDRRTKKHGCIVEELERA